LATFIHVQTKEEIKMAQTKAQKIRKIQASIDDQKERKAKAAENLAKLRVELTHTRKAKAK
jgi:hypothetical protein